MPVRGSICCFLMSARRFLKGLPCPEELTYSVVCSAVARVVGLVPDVRHVAEEGHGFDCGGLGVSLCFTRAKGRNVLLIAGKAVESRPVVFWSVHPVEPPACPPRMLPTVWAPCDDGDGQPGEA